MAQESNRLQAGLSAPSPTQGRHAKPVAAVQTQHERANEVDASPISPYPHPTFPEGLLPEHIRGVLPRDKGRHYPQQYLDQIKALDSPANNVSHRRHFSRTRSDKHYRCMQAYTAYSCSLQTRKWLRARLVKSIVSVPLDIGQAIGFRVDKSTGIMQS